jgi:hypothetical protein
MDARITTPPDTAHAKIGELYRYWLRMSPGDGKLPGRRHVDPIDIPALLANIWLLDVVGHPVRFRFRLIGDAARRLGIAAKRGEFVDKYNAENDAPVQDMHFAVSERLPVWFRGRAYFPMDAQIGELERLILPLAADGSAVDMLLGLTVFYRLDGREA